MTHVHFFIRNFRKINFKCVCSIHYSDNTVLVLSEDSSAPTVRENLEYGSCTIYPTFRHKLWIKLYVLLIMFDYFFKNLSTNYIRQLGFPVSGASPLVKGLRLNLGHIFKKILNFFILNKKKRKNKI